MMVKEHIYKLLAPEIAKSKKRKSEEGGLGNEEASGAPAPKVKAKAKPKGRGKKQKNDE